MNCTAVRRDLYASAAEEVGSLLDTRRGCSFVFHAATAGMTLGGGCEVALHAARVQASAELYMGMVEVGVGVIPGGGGCKEALLRKNDAREAFELIGYTKVSPRRGGHRRSASAR